MEDVIGVVLGKASPEIRCPELASDDILRTNWNQIQPNDCTAHSKSISHGMITLIIGWEGSVAMKWNSSLLKWTLIP